MIIKCLIKMGKRGAQTKMVGAKQRVLNEFMYKKTKHKLKDKRLLYIIKDLLSPPVVTHCSLYTVSSSVLSLARAVATCTDVILATNQTRRVKAFIRHAEIWERTC